MAISRLDGVNKNYMLLLLRYTQIISVSILEIYNEVYDKDFIEYDESTLELVKRESDNIEMYYKTLEVLAPPTGTEDIHSKCGKTIENYVRTSKTIFKYIKDKRLDDLDIALEMLKECTDEHKNFEDCLRNEIGELILLEEE